MQNSNVAIVYCRLQIIYFIKYFRNKTGISYLKIKKKYSTLSGDHSRTTLREF